MYVPFLDHFEKTGVFIYSRAHVVIAEVAPLQNNENRAFEDFHQSCEFLFSDFFGLEKA